MALPDFARLRTLFQRRNRDKFQRFNIIFIILVVGWLPSIAMLVVSYTILTHTLESKILRDRQTFVNLIAHLVWDDLYRTSGIVGYYQTQPRSSRKSSPVPRRSKPLSSGSTRLSIRIRASTACSLRRRMAG